MNYRQLTEQEIRLLEDNSCWAEDWSAISVAEDFKANYFHRVMFYGTIRLGTFEKSVEVSKGFVKHSGINNATLVGAKLIFCAAVVTDRNPRKNLLVGFVAHNLAHAISVIRCKSL